MLPKISEKSYYDFGQLLKNNGASALENLAKNLQPGLGKEIS
jgi:hypothetical protein